MSSGRRSLVSIAIVLLTLLTGACGDDPPTKEIQQAQQAIDAARTSGAARYASDDFGAAQDALKRAQDAVVARDYRQALNDALDARDRAQTAAAEAADNKAKARTDADKALHDAALTIVDARAKLRTAETGRRAPRAAVVALRRDVTDAESRVQEARTAFDRGDYLDALDLLGPSVSRLNDAVRALDTPAPPVVRRRR